MNKIFIAAVAAVAIALPLAPVAAADEAAPSAPAATAPKPPAPLSAQGLCHCTIPRLSAKGLLGINDDPPPLSAKGILPFIKVIFGNGR